MVKKMNKRGVTLLELLISISLLSVILLLLVKVMFSLDQINNNKTYASSDEIIRTEIIKKIESDFLNLKLKGISIAKDNTIKIVFNYESGTKELKIEKNKLSYDSQTYTLKSKNALYDLCPRYLYQELDDQYYLISISIPVLIEGVNTTEDDDIILTYIGLKNSENNYIENYSCF